MASKCLIVVDYQYDFADPNGSLYVKGGETIKEGIDALIKKYKDEGNLVVFSRDCHPEDHISFEQWAPHCVIGTKGVELYTDDIEPNLLISKGVYKDSDSYSAFYISEDESSELDDFLQQHQIKDLEICGLALDVCVNSTYLDAKDMGYNAVVNLNLTKQISSNFRFKA